MFLKNPVEIIMTEEDKAAFNMEAHCHVCDKMLGNYKVRITITKSDKWNKINCIPNNMEKYMTFSMGQLQFIDSLQFLNSSLDNLEKGLKKEYFKITSRDLTENKLKLLCYKGVYPYEYVDSHQRFSETTLPPKVAFYSQITRNHIEKV